MEDFFPNSLKKILFLKKKKEKKFENVFAEVPYQENSPTTFEESLHLNNLFVEPEYQDNPLALVIYQPPLGHPQMETTHPTFPFPIPP